MLTLRQALRQFRQSKGIVAATLLTLALCIGATTAIFSSVYALMLKPLPFHEPDQIVELYTSAKKAGLERMPANVVLYLDYSRNAGSYDDLSLWQFFQGMVGDEDTRSMVGCAKASAGIFSILRLQPVLGTFFTKEQNKPGADMVVVLTESCWKQDYQGSPDVIGKQVRIYEDVCRVIGVAPKAFEGFDARVKYIQAISWSPGAENPQSRYGVGLQLYGRLKPGVTAGQADAEAKTREKRFVDAGPAGLKQFVERSGMTMNVGGVQDQRVAPVRPMLLLLQGGVAFVLLIGCVNVANLLLVRSNARQSELAIRSALGASRGTIARQQMLESLLLTLTGAVLGLGFAWGALRVTNFYTAKMLPQSLPAQLDLRMLGFAMGLSVLIGLLVGLVPVWHIWRTNLAEVIQRSSRGASSARGVRALSSLLVVAQFAVALVLLTGAGLLMHSFAKALDVSVGFDPHRAVTGRLYLPRSLRSTEEAGAQIRRRVLDAMREIPGVDSSALSFSRPFEGGLPINSFALENDSLPPGSPQPGAYRVVVSPDYLKTLGLKLREGRFYEETDLQPGHRSFVVDQSFARKYFPNGSAIGGRFSFSGRPAKPEDWPTIIGVVADVPHNGVEEKSGNPFIYELMQGGRPGVLTLLLRSSRPAGDVISTLRGKLRAIDPVIFLFDTGAMDQIVSSSFDNRRAVTLLLAAFAGLALFLSALGIYGVLAYDVSQRTREIGIRGAVGAARGQIVGMILRQGLVKAGVGLMVGAVAAALLSQTIKSLLFQVQPTDPLVHAGVAALLLLVALLASYLPARRAAKIDPMVALRTD